VDETAGPGRRHRGVFERIRSGVAIAGEVFAAMRLERSGEDLFALVERLREKGP